MAVGDHVRRHDGKSTRIFLVLQERETRGAGPFFLLQHRRITGRPLFPIGPARLVLSPQLTQKLYEDPLRYVPGRSLPP